MRTKQGLRSKSTPPLSKTKVGLKKAKPEKSPQKSKPKTQVSVKSLSPTKLTYSKKSAKQEKSKPKAKKPQQSLSESESNHEEDMLYAKDTFLVFVDTRFQDGSDSENEHDFELAKVIKDVQVNATMASVVVFYKDSGLSYLKGEPLDISLDCVVMAVAAKQAKDGSSAKLTRQVANQAAKQTQDVILKLKDMGVLRCTSSQQESSDSSSSEEEVKTKRPQRPLIVVKKGPKSLNQTAPLTQTANLAANKDAPKAEEIIDTSTKLNPMLGKKRPPPTQTTTTINKRKKIDSDHSEIVEVVTRKKPQVKKPLVFKLGKWNPDTEIVQKDDPKHNAAREPIFDCCLRCNSRNLFRAVYNQDLTLFKQLLYDKQHLPVVNAMWSAHVKQTVYDLVMERGNVLFLEAMLKLKTPGVKMDEVISQMREFYVSRVMPRPMLLQQINTGTVSSMAYHARVRTVQMTRGNRQGNNAFLQLPVEYPQIPAMSDWSQLSAHIKVDTLAKESLLRQQSGLNLDDGNLDKLCSAALKGWRDVCVFIIKPLLVHENYGFNQLHLDVLQLENLQDKINTNSITKKSSFAQNVTPLHLACINPNTQVLKKMLDQKQDTNVQDLKMRKLVHYAAACESPKSLELLIEAGANVNDLAEKKTSALLYAAIANRPENIKVLLKASPLLFKVKDTQSMNAMAHACQLGNIEAVEALLDSGVFKVNTGSGRERLPPLSFAASLGNFELCEFLLSRKARVTSKDKYKRTPLSLAVMNGHARVASLLLQHGADWNHSDSSMNTVLHYAAGFGWIQCIDLLIKHGADVNALNAWKIAPITIAMLTNHVGTVKRLLAESAVNVNGKDDEGRTLLILTVLDISDEKCIEFAEYLLDKGADPNIADVNGNTPLHVLAQFKPVTGRSFNIQTPDIDSEKQTKIQEALIDLFIERGADLNIKNQVGQTCFTLALNLDSIHILSKLSQKVKISENPMILFEFASKFFDDRYKSILMALIEKESAADLTPAMLNIMDDSGVTPFLKFLMEFTNGVKQHQFKTKLLKAIDYYVFKHKCKAEQVALSNQDIFDDSAAQKDTAYMSVQGTRQFLTEEARQSLTHKFLYELVTLPTIHMLQFLVSRGSDPQAQVGKLKFYRELDKHKRTLALVETSRGAVQIENAVEMIDTTRKVKLNKEVKTRDQVLTEQSLDRASKSTKKDKLKKLNVQLREFYAEQKFTPEFEKIDGVEVEVEYSKEDGLKTALHVIMEAPTRSVLDFLVNELHCPVDSLDYRDRSPFMIGAKRQPDFVKKHEGLGYCLERLIELGADFDRPNRENQTPFLHFYQTQQFDRANFLLDKGVNINAIDKGGLFALKYALIRRHNDEIVRLVNRGADINLIDHKERNLLHHAINMSSATADATFETEQVLIDLGININAKDYLGRVPLHYAFVKIENWSSSAQMDPIEAVSSLCGKKGLEIDVKDKWQKTPLHYAAQRGAAICSIYLIERSAEIEAKDIYSNTPLGISLLYNHFNYAIILIQRLASVLVPVFHEFPKRLAKQWNDASLASQDVDMDVQPEHRNLFKKKVKNTMFGYDSETESESDADSVENNTHAVFNKQNAFGISVFAKKSALPAAKTQKPKEDEIEKERPPRSTFRIAIQAGQQGLAYLILDKKYDYMLAMQDAMDEKKFQLVLTLLLKTADDEIVCQKNKHKQTLMHILAQNSSGAQQSMLLRIYEAFKKRGVNCTDVDDFGNNPLHYAVEQRCEPLVSILLEVMSLDQINHINKEGLSPMAEYLRDKRGAALQLKNEHNFSVNAIFIALVNKKANLNIVYPEKSLKTALLSKLRKSAVDEAVYRCTPLINFVRHNVQAGSSKESFAPLSRNLLALLEAGATFEQADSDGFDILHHAVVANNAELVNFVLQNAVDKKLVIDRPNADGMTAVHCVVQPTAFGSFENDKVLHDLHKKGFNMTLKDEQGKTPLDYAEEQFSGHMKTHLQAILGRASQKQTVTRRPSWAPADQWQPQQFNFEADYNAFLADAEAKKSAEMAVDTKMDYVPVDIELKNQKQYQVFFDASPKRPWDAFLAKVDLSNGPYGDYVFYKLQLIVDTNRELFIVLTRYGRIGETGMNQRTPFTVLNDAKKEFCTIFKQKTGNEWDTAETEFEKKFKKYGLVKVHYSNIKHQDYLAPFDFQNCAPLQLSKDVSNFVEEISNVTMFQRAVQKLGVNTDLMPISSLQKEGIARAFAILKEIGAVQVQQQELRQVGLTVDLQEFDRIKTEIARLSSKFFELVPMNADKDTITRPIRSEQELKRYYDVLDHLSSVEFTSRILLGALYNQKQVNPIDYVYDSLQAKLQLLDKDTPEFSVIMQYALNTCGSDSLTKKDKTMPRIFKVYRKGEAEKFEMNKHLGNRRLLFHGTNMSNMIGILAQGLRIAPPEAPATGYMFGKGIYFADMFQKSAFYCSSMHSAFGETKVMLLCDVALGKSKKCLQAEFVEKLPQGMNSVHGCGSKGPDFKTQRFVTPDGSAIALGLPIEYTPPKDWEKNQDVQKQSNLFGQGFGPAHSGLTNNFGAFGMSNPQRRNYWTLQHNEYIVFSSEQVKTKYVIQFE